MRIPDLRRTGKQGLDAREIDVDLLRAVVARIIPRDQDPGALDLGTDQFVLRHFSERVADRQLVADGLAALAARSPRQGFRELSDEEQNLLLLEIEAEPWFARLVTITAEGFYADPANGGNAGARSWEMIGYQHRLPDGPSGPPRGVEEDQHDA